MPVLRKPEGPLFSWDGNIITNGNLSAFWSRLSEFNDGFTGQREPFLGTNEANQVGSLIVSATANRIRDTWIRPERAAQFGTFFIWQGHLGRCEPYNGGPAMTISNVIGQGSDALVWGPNKPANMAWRCEQIMAQFGSLFAIASPFNEPDGQVHWYCMYHPTNTGTVGSFSQGGLIDRTTAIARVREGQKALWDAVRVGARRFSTAVVTPPLSNAGGKNINEPYVCFNIYQLLNDSNGRILQYADGVGMHTYDEGLRWEDSEVNSKHSPAHYWAAIKQAQALAGMPPKHFLMVNEGGFDENVQPPPCRTQWNHASDFNSDAIEEQQGPNHAALLPARRRLKCIRAGAMPFWCAYWAVSHYVIYQFSNSGADGKILCPARDNFVPREPSWTAYRILCNVDRYRLNGPGPWDLAIASKPWANFTNNTTKATVGFHDPLTWIVLANFSDPEKADPNQAVTPIYHEWDRANFATNALTFEAPTVGQGNQTNRAGRLVVLPFHGDWKVTCSVAGNTGTARLVVRGFNKYDGNAKVVATTTQAAEDLMVSFRHRPHDHPAVPNVPYAAVVLEATRAAVFSNVKISRMEFKGPQVITGTVTITAPASGSTVSGTVALSADARFTGANVANVQFQIDGANVGVQDTEIPFEATWDSTTASNGQHAISAVATASTGHTATHTISVTTDNTVSPPTAAITNPAAGSTISGTVTVIGTADFPGGSVASVQFRRDGVNLGAADTTSPYSVSWNTEGVTDGQHTLSCIATKVGGGSVTSPTITVTVNNLGTGPTGYLSDPLPLSVTNPFNRLSACNRAIGSGATYAAANDPTTVDWRKASNINLNSNNNYGHRWAIGRATDPLVTVTHNGNGAGANLPVSIRIPTGFTGGTVEKGIDQGVSIWNDATDRVDQFFQFYRTGNTTAQASGRYNYDPSGLDWGSPRKSSSASEICQLGLMLRGDEINPASGPDIHHALNVALGARPDSDYMQLARYFVEPGNGVDSGTNDPGNNLGSIPYGALYGLLPESKGGPNIDALFPSGTYVQQQRRLARCFRDYGVYVVDRSGNATMRCDQFVTSAVRQAMVTATASMIRHMYRITNNDMSQLVAGGGNARAANRAYNAGSTPVTGTTAEWFSASSPWNVLAKGSVDPNSYTMVENPNALGSLKQGEGIGLQIQGTDSWAEGEHYGMPVYEATASTPRVSVSASTDWWNGHTNVPIPANAVTSQGTDRHLIIWDKPNKMLYEYWDAQKIGGNWRAQAGASFASDGPGYSSGIWTLGARAYGGSGAAGLIRRHEMVAGVIPHALAMAYDTPRGLHYARGLGVDGVNMNIASHCDSHADANRNGAGSIPEGARLRLKASVDVNARCGSNTACKVIGTALQKYGAFIVDTAGAMTIYSEILSPHGQTWSGLLSVHDVTVFKAADFELLSLPATLTPAP